MIPPRRRSSASAPVENNAGSAAASGAAAEGGDNVAELDEISLALEDDIGVGDDLNMSGMVLNMPGNTDPPPENSASQTKSKSNKKHAAKKKKKGKEQTKQTKPKKKNKTEDDPATLKKKEILLKLASEDARKEFEEERDSILAQVPMSVREMFGQTGFAKWSKSYLPALVMNPYKVPPGQARNIWLQMFNKMQENGRPLEKMSLLVYWYGEEQPANFYSLVAQSGFVPYEKASKKMLDIAKNAQKKLNENKKLTPEEQQKIRGIEQLEEDRKKDAHLRIRGSIKFDEGYQLLSLHDLEDLEDDGSVELGSDEEDEPKTKAKNKKAAGKETAKPVKKAKHQKKSTKASAKPKSKKPELSDDDEQSYGDGAESDEAEMDNDKDDLDYESEGDRSYKKTKETKQKKKKAQSTSAAKAGKTRRRSSKQRQAMEDSGEEDAHQQPTISRKRRRSAAASPTSSDDEDETGRSTKKKRAAKKMKANKRGEEEKKEHAPSDGEEDEEPRTTKKRSPKKKKTAEGGDESKQAGTTKLHKRKKGQKKKAPVLSDAEDATDGSAGDNGQVEQVNGDKMSPGKKSPKKKRKRRQSNQSEADAGDVLSEPIPKSAKWKRLRGSDSANVDEKSDERTAKVMKKPKIRKRFKKNEVELEPILRKWRKAIQKLAVDDIFQCLDDVLDKLDDLCAPFIEVYSIPGYLKETKVVLKQKDADLQKLADIRKSIKDHYNSEKTYPVGDFEPKESMQFPELAEPLTSTTCSTEQGSEVAPENGRAESRDSFILDSQSSRIGIDSPGKLDHAAAVVTENSADLSHDAKSPTKEESSAESSNKTNGETKSDISDWTKGPVRADTTNPQRLLGIEFLRQMAKDFPEGTVDADSVAVSVESALFEWAIGKTDKRYWDRLHSIVAGVIGDVDPGSLMHSITSGEFQTAADLVCLSPEKLRASFNGADEAEETENGEETREAES